MDEESSLGISSFTMHTLPAPYFPQDDFYRPRRRRKKHRASFHPTITDDLGSVYDDDDFPSNLPAQPYWQGHPPYSAYPPPPQYPAPYPYQPYPQYQQYPPPHDPRRPESNFGMLIAGAFVFSMIAFAAVWYDNAHEKAEPIIIRPAYTPPSEPFAPANAQRKKLTPPKPYLTPLSQDMFAVFLETFGTEAEAKDLKADLQRADITTVKMGEGNFWACILAESAGAAEKIRAEVTEQYTWTEEPYLINLLDNCTGLERRGDKWVCGEK